MCPSISLGPVNSYFKSLSFSKDDASLKGKGKLSRLFITISRQPGAGAITIGEKTAEFINNKKEANWPRPWTVFDKNLIKSVLEEHNLPDEFEKYMPEGKISQIQDILDDLFGVHPPAIALVHKTSETILHLAQTGNVILVGRGADIVTREIEGGFHIRLIGSLGNRVQRVMEFSRLDKKEAEKLIAKAEKDRKKYFKEYFSKNAEDPLLYDMLINTDFISYDNAAKMIVDSAFHSYGGI